MILHPYNIVGKSRLSYAAFSTDKNGSVPFLEFFNDCNGFFPAQQKAWKEWRDIVRLYDPTRHWISSDGEDDGNGILPVTVGHYGDINSMKNWINIGKPWGIGEHSMAYYGTPEQVSKYNGERGYAAVLAALLLR